MTTDALDNNEGSANSLNHPAAHIAAAGFCYWFCIGGTFSGALSWLNQSVFCMFFFVIAVFAGWKLWNTNSPLGLHTPTPAVVVGLTLLVLDSFSRAAGRQSWQAGEDLALTTSTVILFFAALNLPRARHEGLVFGLVFSVSIATAIGVILASLSGYRELAMPMGNRVLMTAVLIMSLPLAVGLLASSRINRMGRVVLAVIVFVLAAGIVKTRSVSGVCLLGFGALAFAINHVPRSRWKLLGAMAAVPGVLLVSVRFEPLVRLNSIALAGQDPTSSLNDRVRYWDGAMRAIHERSLLGRGPGEVGIEYPTFRIQNPRIAPHGEVVTELHSVPVQWLFEFGIVGFLIRGLTLTLFLCSGFTKKSALQQSAVIAMLAFSIFSVFEYQLDNPAIQILFCLNAVVAAPSWISVRVSTRYAHLLGILVIITAMAAFGSAVKVIYANYLLNRSFHEAPARAIESVLLASMFDDRGGVYDAMSAVYLDRMVRNSPAAASGRDFVAASAERHYATAIRKLPVFAPLQSSYGGFQIYLGKPCEAISHLEIAVSLDFYFSLSHFDLANTYLSCASAEIAKDEAAIAILTNPTLAFATIWCERPSFLISALDVAEQWMLDRHLEAGSVRARKFLQFLKNRRELLVRGDPPAMIRLKHIDQVAVKVADDPLAFMFHRKSPPFQTTEIEINGLTTGTWTPEGIGHWANLSAVEFERVYEYYRQRDLSALMKSLT